ncbi:uncharacterized protein PG986_000858 [Apiospora aurea]|uniref:Uncharacterized protein n=1 Tax=Apiospora aurea TaxID=335848 RepID=A0ABR1QV61_9PEZI
MLDRSACSQHTVWLVVLVTATLTSIFLGFAVAISSSPSAPALHATCATKSDPVFWQRLAQLFVHLALLACLVSPAVRPHTRDCVRLSAPGRGWFFAAVGLSALARVLSLVSYAAACGNPGWTAALFMGWIADVTLLGAAAQLAGGITRSRRRSSSSGTFAMGPIRTPAPADVGTQS